MIRERRREGGGTYHLKYGKEESSGMTKIESARPNSKSQTGVRIHGFATLKTKRKRESTKVVSRSKKSKKVKKSPSDQKGGDEN